MLYLDSFAGQLHDLILKANADDKSRIILKGYCEESESELIYLRNILTESLNLVNYLLNHNNNLPESEVNYVIIRREDILKT